MENAASRGSIVFSSLYILASTISSGTIQSGIITSGNISAQLVYISTLSSAFTHFQTMRGSTMSSLTQESGRLTATQITASSFSGNYGDALTSLIQYL
jgi:hypothetical protein